MAKASFLLYWPICFCIGPVSHLYDADLSQLIPSVFTQQWLVDRASTPKNCLFIISRLKYCLDVDI